MGEKCSYKFIKAMDFILSDIEGPEKCVMDIRVKVKLVTLNEFILHLTPCTELIIHKQKDTNLSLHIQKHYFP